MRGEILASTQVLLGSVGFFWDIQKSGKICGKRMFWKANNRHNSRTLI